jgi:hypothetical protein
VILLAGGSGTRESSSPIDASWGMADFVLSGSWAAVVRDFNRAAWKSMFA